MWFVRCLEIRAMKPLVVSLGVLLAGSAAGSAYLWHTGSLAHEALSVELAEAKNKLDASAGMVASLRLDRDDLTTRLAAVELDRETLTAQVREQERLAQERQRIDALSRELARNVQDLAQAVNTTLAQAWLDAGAAQESLFQAPTDASRKAFAESVTKASEAAAAADALRAQLEDFVLAHENDLRAAHAFELDAARARIIAAGEPITRVGDATQRTLASLREVPFTALASEDWRTTALDLGEGEVFAIQSQGQWRWSPVMGSEVGASGQRGPSSMRLRPDLGNGALLVRVRGSERIHPGDAGVLPDRPGQVEVRINDTTTSDNKGAMELRLVAFRPLD
jgi:hypothetical protein